MAGLIDDALQLVREGRPVDGRALLEAETERSGSVAAGTSAHFSSLQDLARFLVYVDQRLAATEVHRVACALVPADDPDAVRSHLTFLMNLGDLLVDAGDLVEAEPVLRAGLRRREAFYGRSHPGYAFGLEPLGTLLLDAERFDEAYAAIDEMFMTFWEAGHERVGPALALLAEARAARAVRAAQDIPGNLFQGFALVPEELARSAVRHLTARIRRRPLLHFRPVVDELETIAIERFGDADRVVAEVRAAQTNLEAALGPTADSARRVAAAQRWFDGVTRAGDLWESAQAGECLALALGDAGDTDAAIEMFRLVMSLEPIDLLVRSFVARNAALHLVGLGRPEEAEEWFTSAIAEGERSEDRNAIGRAEVAYGIHLVDSNDRAGAEAHLSRAVQLLSRGDADSLLARANLLRQRWGSPDIESVMPAAIEEACRLDLLDELPRDLVRDVKVAWGDDGLTVNVTVRRALQEGEAANLDWRIEQIVAEFRSSMAATSYSPD